MTCPEARSVVVELVGFFSLPESEVALLAKATSMEKLARSTLSAAMLIKILDKPGPDKVKTRRGAQAVVKECNKYSISLPKYLGDRAQQAMTMSL